ncbi:2OG-Fe(II) oxygenase [Novosphingobium aerophilum]|uniref:2OG-Fe(II) oxygenase n=1 Tax=Novosphingobium TaxID=165696 RepID=UPI002D7A3445|nr:2OG-Fe(II) oxygenase [Novosphingobium sp. RL4]WRT91542.1 2OG-Fe(II) oxygenase [Novosphingobium sp. RL4]
MQKTIHPDSETLTRIGSSVRGRLSESPAIRRVPVEGAEIYTAEQFLSPVHCSHLIGLIDAVACPSRLAEEKDWEGYRTSFSGDIDPNDLIVRALDTKLSELTGIDSACGESAQGQRYNRGEFYHEHWDWFDTSAPYWPREKRNGGQRSWTAMIYLNTVDEGGMTDFVHLGLKVQPIAGTLLIWNNALPDGTPNPLTMHAARPVVRGVKYVVTKWFRARYWS